MQSWTSGLLCQKPGKLRGLTDRARGTFSAPRFLTFLSCEDLTFQERRETDWLESLPTPWLERKDCLTESPTTTGGMGNHSSKKNYGSTAKRREREQILGQQDVQKLPPRYYSSNGCWGEVQTWALLAGSRWSSKKIQQGMSDTVSWSLTAMPSLDFYCPPLLHGVAK